MRLNPLSELLKDFSLPEDPKRQPSLPPIQVTPKPQSNKVVGDPTRLPVNKQAAMIIAPVTSWLSKPLPPEKLPSPESAEVARLKAELKSERNDHAATRDTLGEERRQLREANAIIVRLRSEVSELKAACREKDSIIAQLEDLRL